MGLNAILLAIELSGEGKVQEIEQQALDQAKELLASARLEAQQIEEDTYAKELVPAYRERARIIHRAHLERLQIIGNVREALVDKALDQARGCLSRIRSNPVYPAVLRKLIHETLAEFEDTREDIPRARIVVDSRDRELIDEIMIDMGLAMSVEYDLICWGGVIIKSSDSRVVIINTLDSRFNRAAPFLRRYLATLFEHHQLEVHFNQGKVSTIS